MAKVESTQRDPVCGMLIDTAAAGGRRQVRGQTYYFCSSQCLAAYDRQPAKFVRHESEGGQTPSPVVKP